MERDLPELGVGVTYIAGLHELLEISPELVDVVEVEPQTLWFANSPGEDEFHIDEDAFQRVLALPQRKLVHGIGFPVGGTLLPPRSQLEPLRRMVSLLRPPWISEHLSFNRIRIDRVETCTGFLLPPRQNDAGIEAAVRSIRQFAHDTQHAVAVETGVSYLQPRPDELPDGEFVAEVVRRAECGILLDLHNLYTNERNGRQSIAAFLSDLPLNRVWEVHLAGGSERGSYWLDSHSGPTPDDLFTLARDIIAELPNLKALIFELFPAYLPTFGSAAVAKELERIRGLWDARSQGNRRLSPARNRQHTPAYDAITPREWEDTLGAAVIGRSADTVNVELFGGDPGIGVTRELLEEFRASMIVSTLRLTSRLLILSLGEAAFWKLLRDYWKGTPPHIFASSEAVLFADYVLARELTVPWLDEVIDFETTALRVLLTRQPAVVRFSHDPSLILLPLARAALPQEQRAGVFEIEITPETAGAESNPSELHAQIVVH